MPSPYVSSEQLKLLVRNTLLAAESLTDLVDNRIHGAHLQDPDAKTVEFPLVVLDFKTGSVDWPGAYQAVTMDLWAYSRRSAGHALQIYDACFANLHQQGLRITGVKVAGYAQETMRPNEGWNDVVRGYYCQGEFTLRTGYRA